MVARTAGRARGQTVEGVPFLGRIDDHPQWCILVPEADLVATWVPFPRCTFDARRSSASFRTALVLGWLTLSKDYAALPPQPPAWPGLVPSDRLIPPDIARVDFVRSAAPAFAPAPPHYRM
jgi:hypothetical protein